MEPSGAGSGKENRKLLIVDDEEDLRRTLAGLLEASFAILQAADGPQALALIERERPRIMLLDVSMPGMDGLEVLEAARRLDPELVVVMLTAEADVEIAKKALQRGAVEYVTKPFDSDYLRTELGRLLDGPLPETRPWRVEP